MQPQRSHQQQAEGGDRPAPDRRLRNVLGVRAELSDARRTILHRQEREALAVLAAKARRDGDGTAAQARETLQIRADLLELTVLKQARVIAEMDESLQREAARVDELSALIGGDRAGRREDPRHIDNISARLEALELWVLRNAS